MRSGSQADFAGQLSGRATSSLKARARAAFVSLSSNASSCGGRCPMLRLSRGGTGIAGERPEAKRVGRLIHTRPRASTC